MFRRQSRFRDLVERQLDLFAEDEAELLEEAVEAEERYTDTGAEDAEEAYGDYQLVVDAIADRLLDIRETYATRSTRTPRRSTRPSSPASRRSASAATRRCSPTSKRCRRGVASPPGAPERRGCTPGGRGCRKRASFRWRDASCAAPLLEQRAAERVVRVVVDRRQLQHLAELALGRRASR